MEQPSTDRVVWALRRAFQAVEGAKERRLRDLGVAGAHYGILINLAASPGITGAELARRLHVTPQNVASLMGKLVDRGWVQRRGHPLHAHVLEVHLTDEGRRVLKAADTEVAALEVALRSHLGASESRALRDLLEATAAFDEAAAERRG